MLLHPEHSRDDTPWFPDPSQANAEGLLMMGGHLTPEWLLQAYHTGIFPWYSQGEPILWWSPDPRMVVKPGDVHVSKTMSKLLRKNPFTITYNKNFLDVILMCKRIKRKSQPGTWITNDIVKAYLDMHELGYALSVEVWLGQELVGGLYGINLKEKGVFCGESMFSTQSNASKVGFITLSRKLEKENYNLIDCQMYTDHLASLGASEIPRIQFLKYLQ